MKFPIDSSINTAMTYEMFSRDVALVDVILDLIDNSIDAARSVMESASRKVDDVELRFDGFEIQISLDAALFSITDNCSGLTAQRLQEDLFYLGSRNTQRHAIGAFGVGFTRACWKIAEQGLLISDNGKTRHRVGFACQDFNDPDNPIHAEQIDTHGTRNAP